MTLPFGKFIVHIDNDDKLIIDGMDAQNHMIDYPDDTLACIREMYELANSMHHTIIDLQIKLASCKGEDV